MIQLVWQKSDNGPNSGLIRPRPLYKIQFERYKYPNKNSKFLNDLKTNE